VDFILSDQRNQKQGSDFRNVQSLVSVLNSAFSKDIVCSSSVICVKFGSLLDIVVRATSGVSTRQQKYTPEFRGVHWIDWGYIKHSCV